jgi:hypothetical protein
MLNEEFCGFMLPRKMPDTASQSLSPELTPITNNMAWKEVRNVGISKEMYIIQWCQMQYCGALVFSECEFSYIYYHTPQPPIAVESTILCLFSSHMLQRSQLTACCNIGYAWGVGQLLVTLMVPVHRSRVRGVFHVNHKPHDNTDIEFSNLGTIPLLYCVGQDVLSALSMKSTVFRYVKLTGKVRFWEPGKLIWHSDWATDWTTKESGFDF